MQLLVITKITIALGGKDSVKIPMSKRALFVTDIVAPTA